MEGKDKKHANKSVKPFSIQSHTSSTQGRTRSDRKKTFGDFKSTGGHKKSFSLFPFSESSPKFIEGAKSFKPINIDRALIKMTSHENNGNKI